MTKPGRYGALTRFAVRYDDGDDGAVSPDNWGTWAYDAEHALQNFYDSADGDTGWRVLGVSKVRAKEAV